MSTINKFRSMGRRDVLKLTGGVVAASTAGCLSNGNGGEGGDESLSTAITNNPNETVNGKQIHLAMDGGVNSLPFEWSRDEVQSETGVELTNMTEFPFSGLFDKLMTEFTTGSNAFDLVGYHPQMLGTFASNGHLTPLDNMMEIDGWSPAFDDILKPFREVYTQWDGNTYGLPLDGDVFMLSYRRDLFEKHDVKIPETWAQFNEAARYFTEETDDVEYGMATFGKRGFAYAWFLTRFGGLGGKYFDEEMNPQIDSEAGRRSLESWEKALQYAPDATASYDSAAMHDAFFNNEIAMAIQWADLPKKLARNENTKGKWGVKPVPGWEDGSAASAMPVGRVVGIPSYISDEQKLAAYRYAQVATSTSISKHFVSDPDCGADPYRISQMDNPEVFTQPNELREEAPESSIAFQSIEEAEEYTNAMQQTLQQGYPEPYWPGATEYIKALDIEISRFISGQTGVEETITNIQTKWESIVEDLGREQQKEHYQKVIQAWESAGLWD